MAQYVPSAASRARCEAEMQKPIVEWKTITMDTVNNGHDKKAPGVFYGIDFPWSEVMLHEWGAEWLTKAFHAAGTLDKSNKVKRIVTEDNIKITTGNNGGKFLFEVEYEQPSDDLDTKLFAKVPFPLEGATKTDRLSSSVNKQPMEFNELNTSRLMEGFMPMKIPKMYFADISNETSNWILITECIKFAFDEQNYGRPGEKLGPLAPYAIEGPYDKCIDGANLRGPSIDYYMCMVKKGAMLAGMQKSGGFGVSEEVIKRGFSSSLDAQRSDFPMKPDDVTGEPKQAIESKITSGLKFFEQAKVVFPEFVTTDEFKTRFRRCMTTLNAYAVEIAYWKEGFNKDYTVLAHQNMNVDNAYFWRDENGEMDCGVLDWGGFGATGIGHKLWWWLYCQDYDALKGDLDKLLEAFVDICHASGGPKLDKVVLRNQLIITGLQQMIGLISAVGQINRMCKPENWKTIEDRYDPRIADNIDGKSSLRLYLHVMNSVMRMIMEWDADEVLYKGFVEDFYEKELGLPKKTDIIMGLDVPKGNDNVKMTFEDMYEMQDLFINVYSTSEFQQKLHKALAGLEGDPAAQTIARSEVCLPFQVPVITRYGFTPDKKGVSGSLKAFRNPEIMKGTNGTELMKQSERLNFLVNPSLQDDDWKEQHGIFEEKKVSKVIAGDIDVPLEEARYVKILTKELVHPLLLTEYGDILDDDEKSPTKVYEQKGQILGYLDEEDKYLIATFEGLFVRIEPDKLSGFEPPPTDEGGFDFVWPGDGDDELEWLGNMVCSSVSSKGFCVMQMRHSNQDRVSVDGPVSQLQKWTRMPEDFEQAYLGRNMEAQKVHWLPVDDMSKPSEDLEDGLQRYDRTLTDLAAAVGPMTQECFGFSGFGRTAGLMRSQLGPKEDLKASNQSLGPSQVWTQSGLSNKVQSAFGFMQYRRLCMINFISGDVGTLTLHPKADSGFEDEVSFPVAPNRTVVFRHDLFSYTYTPEGSFLALQAWLLSEPHQNTVTQLSSETGVAELSRPAPLYGDTGRTVGVMSIATHIPGNSLSTDAYWCMFGAGTDAALTIPKMRWDHDEYYNPDKNAVGFVYSMHINMIGDEIYKFDNDFFNFPLEACKVMDPTHFKTMEIGYETLFRAGWRRKTLYNKDIGVFIGNSGSDIHVNIVQKLPYEDPSVQSWIRTADATSILPTRLAHTYNLKGTNHVNDTACSSSLVAISTCHMQLRPQEPGAIVRRTGSNTKWSLAQGSNALIGPMSWVALCAPKMVGWDGRCFTFDKTANGFGRGEGFSGITLCDNSLQEEPSDRYAMVCGSAVNQDGRSASMTAPHGPSQQECLWNSFREANIVPADVRIAELHGTGTALGDPIEVGALRGVLRKRKDPVYKTSSKSNLAHGEAQAGIAGFIKCVMMTVYSVCAPNIHLLQLNPNADTNAYPVLFASEFSDAGGNSGYAGVSSFGFGGTNARGDVWARALKGPFATGGDLVRADKLNFLRAKQLDMEDRARAIEDPDTTDEFKEKVFAKVMVSELKKVHANQDARSGAIPEA